MSVGSYVAYTPVDFPSDSEAAKCGRYDGPPSRAEQEKIFFLDNEDMALIKGHPGRHIRCGFALQLVTVRYLRCFLTDPLEVPNEVLDVVAAQLQIDDPSCVKRYTERDKTRLEHTWEIAKAFGLTDFASAETELAGKVRAHAWNTGDGPTACFQYAVRWLRQNDVLLPGISTLTRLVARERERATRDTCTTPWPRCPARGSGRCWTCCWSRPCPCRDCQSHGCSAAVLIEPSQRVSSACSFALL
ncbi:DUF4158 domain-containing protein [Streptosporangium sp. NBC_01639]|uniref:DUF4158 domain-containing protein n=1 Tax=Streptosporangium sp. NBC_01639 TaxID=2975948 RepID=UPI0038645D0C|nr:DUF4158 domain-containing protein [Streptosporangium sp. NBC_01639]